ncbi:MAG: ORF6N domain-containing protein [Bacteroidales bacterium]|nr:ORF6N domain-containing protein [Bacteroidales bacterium]
MKNDRENYAVIHEEVNIEQMIHNIRGCQIMLDRDLAALYDVETKVLNQAVKRNIERFPNDFRFQLTKEECQRSQIVTFKYLPYAFTENGIAMLSSVLRSQTAIQMNVRIMRAFTSMRRIMANSEIIFQRITKIECHQIVFLNV